MYLSTDAVKLILVTTYQPGEVICLLQGIKIANGCVGCGDVKLTFQLRATDSNAVVLGVMRSSIERFLVTRPSYQVSTPSSSLSVWL